MTIAATARLLVPTGGHASFRLRDMAMCFTVVAALFYLYSRLTSVPLIHGDEAGYLMNAAGFAGYRTDAFSSYYPGYSLPLVFAFLWDVQPPQVFQLVQAINAVLWGAGGCFLLAMVRAIEPDCSRTRAAALVAVTLSYPAFAVFGSLAMSENLFAPVAIALAWVLMQQARTQAWRHTLAAGVLAALLALTHPKGLLVDVAAACAMVLPWRGQALRVLPRVLVFLVTAFGLWFALRGVCGAFLREALNAEAVAELQHYPGIAEILEDFRRIFTWDGFLLALATAAGQLAYLVVGSLGLVAVGLWICLSRVGAADVRSDVRVLMLFTLLSVALVYAFSVFFMKDGPRADHLMYGRYSESVIAPMLLLGAMWLPMRRMLALAAAVVALLGVVIVLAVGNTPGESVVVVNIAAVDAARRLMGGNLNVAGVLGVGIAAMLLIRAVKTQRAVLALVLIANIAAALEVAHYFLAPGSRYREQQTQLVNHVKARFPARPCVNLDVQAITPWQLNNYQFHLLPMAATAVTAENLFACGDALITTAERMPPAHADALPVAREFDAPETLWLRGRSLRDWIDALPALQAGEDGVEIGTLESLGLPGLAFGWHGVEPWGAWSTERALLALRAPAPTQTRLQLDFNILASDAVPRTVTLRCHGNVLATAEFRAVGSGMMALRRSDLAAAGCLDADQFALVIEVQPAASPKQLGLGEDARVLGVGLQRVRWSATD